MDSNEAERLCEKLFKLVDSGPGKDPEALREVVGIVTTLKRAAARCPRGKLTELEEEFTRWFTARGWRTDIDVEGKQLRYSLPYKGADILAVMRLADPTRVAWSPTDDAAPGWQCGATQHGGFPLDQEMEDSSKFLLENGFQPSDVHDPSRG